MATRRRTSSPPPASSTSSVRPKRASTARGGRAPSGSGGRPPSGSGARAAGRWFRRGRMAAEALLVLVAVGLLALWCSIPNTARLANENPTSTAFIDLRREQARADGKAFDLKWEWRPLGKISRYLRAAVIYSEDARFYTHEGVDWDALEKAFDRNLENGDFSVGGSTITQQLAKNLYLSPSRSLIRKAREMLIAFALEDNLSKQRILELYLNIAEWGDGVFGAEAAARKWFGHGAQSLTASEAARLAIALPNPFKRAPNVHSEELTRKAVRLIRLFRMQGLVNAAQERQALDEVGAKEARVRPDSASPAPAPATAPSGSAPPTSEPPAAKAPPPEPPAEPPAAESSTAPRADPMPPETTPPTTPSDGAL
ncbi:MAG: monofunctional biosynthetic peptidoglycan transglycosylase [Kofleriaceae bacterium]|nr:monofunctional biosynthetic peptidoglycan transglycosylase [Kofleriaceae bacterium]